MKEDTSVVQVWLQENCTWKMQTVLLTSFRGCDGAFKTDPGKKYTRLMRQCILYNADPNSTFFPDDVDFMHYSGEGLARFLNDIDHYPIHWFMHLVHAAEIVGYKCPKRKWADFWMTFYRECLHELHVYPETEEQLDKRLADRSSR